ncbi:HD domain-containing protein [soil metagenome]
MSRASASPSPVRDGAEAIVRALGEAGHVAYFAGGCVRDALLGYEPKDYDIATSARPDQIAALFPRTKSVGAHFGVVLVRRQGLDFEIATFRSDGTYRDGRRPDSVTFSSPEDDAQRRDFTINGLFFDPLTGRVIDFVGGRQDLASSRVRAIGDPLQRFQEDRLRLLRAIRFSTTLDFEIDPATFEAIRQSADSLGTIAPERIRDELVRILLSPRRLRGFDLLVESGLMRAILPEILDLQGCDQPPQWHPEGDVFVHTRLMLGMLPEQASLPLVLSVLLHDIAKPATRTYDAEEGRIRFSGHDKLGAEMAGTILRRLRFPNAIIAATSEAVLQHMVFKDVRSMRESKLRRFMGRPNFPDELELHRVDCSSSHNMLDNYEFLRQKSEDFANEPIIPPPLITGRDLIAAGYSPSPKFAEILNAVQSAQLEGTLATKAQALAFVRQNF